MRKKMKYLERIGGHIIFRWTNLRIGLVVLLPEVPPGVEMASRAEAVAQTVESICRSTPRF
jgi:uncharacterized membrane protein